MTGSVSGVGADALVRVVAAIDPDAAVTAAQIVAARAVPQHTARDSVFPGRVSTQVWADASVVVKGRAEFSLPTGDVDRWVQARVTRERQLGCYPADRTWFAIDGASGVEGASGVDGARSALGVAAVRVRPLHLWEPAELAEAWPQFVREFVALYLDAGLQGWRLDEGLSNFAWGAGPSGVALRYLDDDLYPWDTGIGLGLALDVSGRRLPELGVSHGELFAHELREQLRRRARLLDARDVAEALRASGGSPFTQGIIAGLTRPLAAARGADAAAVTRDAVPHPGPAVVVAEPAPASPAPASPEPAPPAPAPVVSPSPADPASPAGHTLLIADVHANLDALEAVLATPDAVAASRILLLGDVVGYGPDPAAVVHRLAADPRVTGILGNHDLAALHGAPPTFNADATWSTAWTREHLDAAALTWLAALPREHYDPDGWLALHGAPIDPERLNAYVYRMTADDNLAALELDGIRLCLHGNTHIAGAWVNRGRGLAGEFRGVEAPLELAQVHTALVCPGGLGQPRDGMPGAAYAVLEGGALDEARVRYARVGYDHAGVQERMRAEGFPVKLIERLDRAG